MKGHHNDFNIIIVSLFDTFGFLRFDSGVFCYRFGVFITVA